MSRGAIILSGGQSKRMGVPKWSLPFGTETMLARIVRRVGEVCHPVVIVAATAGANFSDLSSNVICTYDKQPDRGPLEGLRAGLKAMPAEVSAALVTTCDAPFIEPRFIAKMFDLLGEDSAAVPVHEGYVHPLSAVYRCTVLDVVEKLLDADRRRPTELLDCIATRRVAATELRDVDPLLVSLQNLNHADDYFRALAAAGFAAPPDLIRRLSANQA